MIQTLIAIFSFYDLFFLLAAAIGVTYDFCRSVIRPGTTVPNL